MPIASLTISMAATVTPSSSLFNKLSDLSFTIHFPSKSKPTPLKPITIKTHFPNFSLLSQTHLCRASSFFDSSQDRTFTEQFDGERATDPPEKARKARDSGGAARIYVGNLPYSMTASQLTEIFGEAGNVLCVEVVYDRVTDRSRGFAFVTMGSVEEAKEAIRLFNSAQIGGRSAKVNFPEVPKGVERTLVKQKIRNNYEGFTDSPHKIYAGNLGWDVTSQALKEAFARQRGFLSARVLYDRASGRSRGFGFVTFQSAEAAEAALNAMNGVEVEGRPLRLNVAKESGNIAPPAADRKGGDLDGSELFS